MFTLFNKQNVKLDWNINVIVIPTRCRKLNYILVYFYTFVHTCLQNTGAAFFAAKKLQVNIQLMQVNHIK